MMGASSYPGLKYAKPEPRVKVRKVKVNEADKHERQVYAAVDRRDKLRCVVTGRKANPYATDSLDRLHHHHILQRGRDQGPTETWNIASVHATAHALIHQNVLTIEGNADVALRIAIKAKVIEDLFGYRRPPAHIEVIADEDWPAWLAQHATRITRAWIKKVERVS